MPNSESRHAPARRSSPTLNTDPPPWPLLSLCLLAAPNRSCDARIVWYEQTNARLSEENRRLSREREQKQRRRAA